MSTVYTLYFSDKRKSGTISVPGTANGPGKNNYDTSLELVGAGYTNFGPAIAQNFLKLLENFSSPNPPINPIEGQLWYDTSDIQRKTLRVFNNSLTSQGWPTAAGIYRQLSDPALDDKASLYDGDIWVDLSNSQLKIRYGMNWTTVGPSFNSGSRKTGSEAVLIQSNTGASYPIIKHYVDNEVVEIISFSEFIPRTVIDGFTSLKPGSNLTSKNFAKYNGVAERASALEISPGVVVRSSEIMKNRTTTRQIHTGTLVVESTNGLQVRSSSNSPFVHISGSASGGTINFSNTSSTLTVGVNSKSYIKFNGNFANIGINTASTSLSPTLDVYGGARFTDAVEIIRPSRTAISITGTATIFGNVLVSGSVMANSGISSTQKISVGSTSSGGTIIEPASNDTYDLGSPDFKFRNLYVSSVGSSSTIYRGTLEGVASGIRNCVFSMEGQVTASSFIFSGNGSTSTFSNTYLTRNAISDQRTASTATSTHELLVLNSATPTSPLEKISKTSFLSDIYPAIIRTGMLIMTAVPNPDVEIPGFLLCDGTPYPQIGKYSNLYNAIQLTYGSAGSGTFRVPDLRTLTQLSNGIFFNYYIKY